MDWDAGLEAKGDVIDKEAQRVAAGVTSNAQYDDMNRWLLRQSRKYDNGRLALNKAAPVVLEFVVLNFYQQFGVTLARRTGSNMLGREQSRNLWWGEAGTGKSAMVHHVDAISDFNNQKIYTEEELGNRKYNMDKQELFTGLREGLKLLKAGETIVCLFPSQKAFGFYGDDNKIGPNTPLICSITLNLITKNK